MVSATSSGVSPNPLSRSAVTGRVVAATIDLALSRMFSRVREPSGRPQAWARPAPVVASAEKPSPVRTRAVPASHGLGTTKGSGPSWSL
ncbi:hypothetical protein SALBM311S_03594 [Streptomyces alboniger]